VNRPETVKVPPEPLRWIGVNAVARALERGDARQEAGRRRGVLNDLIGSGPTAFRDKVVAKG
jgi:hypothetical protein